MGMEYPLDTQTTETQVQVSTPSTTLIQPYIAPKHTRGVGVHIFIFCGIVMHWTVTF